MVQSVRLNSRCLFHRPSFNCELAEIRPLLTRKRSEVTHVARFDDRRRGRLGLGGNFSASRCVLDNERAATVYRPAK
jgi:hypothetical protein